LEDYIAVHVQKKHKFLIGNKSLQFIRREFLGWSFFNALKMSPALEYVSLQSHELETKYLSFAVDAIVQNPSITKIGLDILKYSGSQTIYRRLFETNQITHVSLVGYDTLAPFEVKSLCDTLTSPTLTSMTLEFPDGMKESFEFFTKIPNITRLKFYKGPPEAAKFLATNKTIKKLHIYGGKYKEFNLLSPMILGQLHILTLEDIALGNFDIGDVLRKSTSITKLSLDDNLYGWNNRKNCSMSYTHTYTEI